VPGANISPASGNRDLAAFWVLGSSTLLFRARLITVSAIVLAALLAAPVTADAAKRKVPFGFFGTVLSPSMYGLSDARLNQQMELMARSGVESIRVAKGWQELEPAENTFVFDDFDSAIGAAARHGIQAVVNVTRTPRWASSDPTSGDYWRLPPRDGTYSELMRQLVLRYGPGGTFWRENPSLTPRPVRQWQIWNEPSGPAHWKPRPWAPSYTQLLRSSYEAIHAVDRGAQVVAGPLVATGTYTQWVGARDLLKAGAGRWFDVASVHPFTSNSASVSDSAARLVEIVRRVRAEMNKRGARRKEIILTEMTWPASIGKVPRSSQLHFSTTAKGQAARLKAAYKALARARRKLRITNAYWYTWASTYDRSGSPTVMAFNFSGLTRFRGGPFSPMPVLKAYRSVAAQLEGCRKGANARRCR
jgi:hypothetical protein